jgi:hypothetical protein
MNHLGLFLAYLSPDTMLPATSVLATVAGIVLILGRSSLRFLVRCCRRRFDESSRMGDPHSFHFEVRDEETARRRLDFQ